MQLKILTAVAAALAVATPIGVAASASVEGQAAADPTQHQSRQKERRICRRSVSTGTRLSAPRVCMTKSQWDAEEERARTDVSTMQNRQRVATPGMEGVSRCPPHSPAC